MKKILALLLLSGLTAHAQTITQTFGSGANAFSIDFVTIGNPGNAADTRGSPNPVGSVDYVYNIAKYEINRDMIAKANADGGLGITLFDMSSYSGGSLQNGPDRPATGLSWYEAAKFVNYLNIKSGHQKAYNFDANGAFQMWSSSDSGYDPSNLFRNSLAKYWLPSTDEWYKAAYSSPNGSWYEYTTGSDTPPTGVSSGSLLNTIVAGNWLWGAADIYNAGGISPWGTMAQGGNVWEWIETASDGSNNMGSEDRDMRGSSWDHMIEASASSVRSPRDPSEDVPMTGFRIAMVPEPSSLSLLLAGGAVLMAGRRRSKASASYD